MCEFINYIGSQPGNIMRTFNNLLVLCLGVIVSGCSTYGAKGTYDGGTGYTDRKIEENKYWVRFDGIEYDSQERLEEFWRKRASELCGDNNFTGKPKHKVKKGGYPGFNIYPRVEGNVACKDAGLASKVAPEKYVVDKSSTKIKVDKITLAKEDINKNIIKKLSFHLEKQMYQNSMNIVEAGQNYVSIKVDVKKLRVRGARLAGAMGLFSGADSINSVVKVYKAGNEIGEYLVETSLWEHKSSESKLLKHHALEIVNALKGNI